jgi:uroporphyrinogen-III synthase
MGTPFSIRGHRLDGLRVLVTRPAHQQESMVRRLRDLGAIPMELPVIEIVPLPVGEIEQRLESVEEFDWIVFTSVNTVAVVGPVISRKEVHPRMVAIGSATASALQEIGLRVDVVPDDFVAEAVLDAMIASGVSGQRILLPRAEVARSTLPDGLKAAGATVDVVPVYQTRLPAVVNQKTLSAVRQGNVDIVTFTSPSTVVNLMSLLNGEFPEGVRIACIGPVTERAAKDSGLRVDIVAREYSIPGLVEALVEDVGQ